MISTGKTHVLLIWWSSATFLMPSQQSCSAFVSLNKIKSTPPQSLTFICIIHQFQLSHKVYLKFDCSQWSSFILSMMLESEIHNKYLLYFISSSCKLVVCHDHLLATFILTFLSQDLQTFCTQLLGGKWKIIL